MTFFDDNLTAQERALDRLADGELSLAERRELLSSLDRLSSPEARADGWRRCALSLLEAQVLRRELAAFLTHETPSLAVQVTMSDPSRAVPTPLPARPFGGLRLSRSYALAASALLAFGVGWVAKSADQQFSQLPAPHEQLAVNNTLREQVPQNSHDAVTLVVNDDQGRQQRVRLPLVDAGEVAQMSPDVPVNVKTGLRDYGLDLQSKQRFAPLFFEHGQQLVPMAVPVTDTYVVPANRPVY